ASNQAAPLLPLNTLQEFYGSENLAIDGDSPSATPEVPSKTPEPLTPSVAAPSAIATPSPGVAPDPNATINLGLAPIAGTPTGALDVDSFFGRVALNASSIYLKALPLPGVPSLQSLFKTYIAPAVIHGSTLGLWDLWGR